MTRSLRRALRRCGFDIPFSAVVCPEHLKTIRVGVDQRTEVTVQRALVFLEPPDPDDLRDLVPADAADPDVLIRESPDAHEVARRASRTGTLVYWNPREPIVPFAIYVHQHGWSSAGGATEAALYSEFVCDVRTGIWTLEITSPKAFETAVGFERPHWPALRTERALVKYALIQLESQRDRPQILDAGTRLQWRIVGPAVGERYCCVAFHTNGVTQWQKRLEATSLRGKLRRWFKRVAPV
jgi:hypothetical protein